MLKEQSKVLQNELKEIQERIGTLEKAQAQEKK
jgi:predicted Fe-Mo cluster-binding NifX family protein